MSVYIDRDQLEEFAMNCVGGVVTMKQIHEFPAIHVPPHGRLIDVDAFIKDECNNCDGACELIPCNCLNCTADCRCDFIKDIADAPTIIPAEEAKHEN